ncbi:MAG: ribonucleoside triphosphate reductase, partial [Nanoarchaeota archaeon]|nr:ribonucleoside triphosphate reductase [Nanoarchaeota archaeon]
MISRIRKRDGRIVLFDQERITNAIFKAAQAVGGTDKEIAKELSGQVVKILEERFGSDITPTVEQIQDLVEKVLIENGHAKTAKAYILYRDQRRKLREMAVLTEPIGLVEGYIRQNDWKVNENSNMTYSLQGLNNHISNAIISKYWLDKLYTPRIREAYEKGDIHIHDLGTLGAYCVGWDLKDLLLSGFKGVSGKVESKPPKHFRTSLGQAVNFFYTLQGEAAGAMAFSNFDTLLAPFIAYDKLTSAEIKQALQEFLFNMNVPTRVGFQTPFSNITLDLKVPDFMKEEYVIIGGKLMDKKYKHFQREMDLFNEILAEVILEGDASGRVFTFPIPTYNITKDFEWDNPTYDNIWEMTAKYGVPYFSNFINSDMKPDDAKSMCPLGGEEKVLIKSSRGRIVEYSTIRHIYKGHSKQEEYKVYSCGKFVKGTFNKFRNQKMIKVILVNGHELKMSTKHLNYVRAYEKSKELILKGEELKEGMYLPYSLKTYKGEGGCKELGYFVGAYAGDGSFDEDSAVVFFLEGYYKKETIDKLIKIAKDYFGAHNSIKEYKKTRLVTLKIYSKAAVGLCRDFVEGIAREKHYTAKLFIMSEEFRKGVIEGHYATDGGNRHRIYTSSKKMVETLNMLAATLGTTTSIYEDKRENRLGKEPNYAVLIYQLNRQRYGEIWFKKKEKLWVRIKDIRPISNDTAYCFEVKDDEPMFTVGTTGILTHNCRLRLDQRELRKRGGGLFGSNPLTGSIGVVTINMARIGYLAKTEEEFFERLANLMDVSKESLEVKRKVLEDFTEQNLYPYSKFYLRNMKVSTGLHWKNHFSTIGLLGMNEALLNFMQKDIASEEGKEFTIKVMDFMRKKISEYQQEIGNIYNLEATPGEGSLAPEEKVLISSSDPRLTEIGPLIDGFLEKNRDRIHKIEDTEILPLKQGTLYTYGFSRKTNKIKKYPVTSVIRHKGRSMYEIKTRLGKKVKVTGQHSVFTLNKQGDIEQIKVDKLRQGSYIAVPKRINIQPVNTKFNLIERFKSSPLKNRFYLKTSKEFIEALVNRKQIKDWTRKYYKTEYRTIKSTWKKRCVIPLRLIYDNNIKLNLKVLQKSKIIYRSTKSTKPINTQIRINHDLGFVLGGLLSEGWLGKRPSFYNTNEEYVKKFTQACDTIFGEGSYSLCLKKREKEGRKPMYTVTLSKVIGLVLKDVMQLKGLSGEKSVPSFVYASKDETIKGLLKAFTLGDGTFYSKESKGDYNIRLYTKSKDL